MRGVNPRFAPWRQLAAAGLAWLLLAPAGSSYERIQTHGRRVWIGPGDLMTLTEPERDRVALFDVSGERPRKLGEFGEQGADPWRLRGPHGAVATLGGELVVADSFNHRIQSFDIKPLRAGLRPPLLRVWGAAGGYAGGLDAPMALATRPGDDRLYVADTRNHRVLEFDRAGRPTGLVIGSIGTAKGDLGWPSALAFDGDGRTLYVAEEWNARVSAFDADSGRFLFALGPAAAGQDGPGTAAGLDWSPDGDLLVADQAGRRIVRLRPERGADGRPTALRVAGSWGRAGHRPGELQYPQSIAADAHGRVYVCDRLDGRCQMFAADGRFLASFGDEWKPAEWTAPPSAPASNRRGWREIRSNAGTFSLRFRTDPEPIPLNEPFEIVVELEGARTDGEGAGQRLRVDAAMPDHRHGMNTMPRVERVGAGRYHVGGLLFHMGGHWELHFDLLREGVLERAQCGILVE